ncbi:hypothetical protein J2S62_002705 [Enteractinococcus fodinae]|uniref:Uncharacterized protein n=1 Tax=Enteractinococcus fodinae TaxID=684663 RepID=A0ABU2B4C0_9MICC|nr:hypothetical protein [Enteractinococcus fodinae]
MRASLPIQPALFAERPYGSLPSRALLKNEFTSMHYGLLGPNIHA